jgi:hypothetical protein
MRDHYDQAVTRSQGPVYRRCEVGTRLQVFPIDPHLDVVKFQQFDEEVDEIFVFRAVRHEYASHWLSSFGLRVQ